MKTIEELEALVETITRERDAHLRDAVKYGREYDEVSANWDRTLARLDDVTRERNLSLAAWEAAGMTGRDAQSAMLELARQLEEARSEIATLTAALDERDVEAERGLEQYDRLVRENATLTSERDQYLARAMRAETERAQAQRELSSVRSRPLAIQQRDEARAEVERLTYQHAGEVERLKRQLADQTNETTHYQVMCKREGEEIERLARQVELLTDRLSESRSEVERITDERDELLVRVANQDAELRATRESYNEACAEIKRTIGKAIAYDLDAAGIDRRIKDSVDLVELRAEVADLKAARDEARVDLAALHRERDDARAAWAKCEARLDAASAEVERLREESATQADISSSTIARLKQQLREAQADVQRISDESTHWQVMLKRETEEVARLERERIGIRPIDEACSDAYRRGAEAMREACASKLSGLAFAVAPEDAAKTVRALPIPEEP